MYLIIFYVCLFVFLRNMKKAFYASAFIFETLKVFGEVSDEVCHIVVMEIISVWLGAVGYYGDN